MSLTSIKNFFCAITPICFIWSTPLLSRIGVCRSDYDKLLGHSLSRYISTPQATGMMAVTFFSIANIMISKRYLRAFEFKENNLISPDYQILNEKECSWKMNLFITTGYTYEAFFGLFLCAPCVWTPTIHGVSVIIFSTSAYIHMLLLQYSPELNQNWKFTLMCINFTGTSSMIGMSVCRAMVNFNVKLPVHLFWSLECLGLSSLVLFMYFAQIALPEKTSSNDETLTNPLL